MSISKDLMFGYVADDIAHNHTAGAVDFPFWQPDTLMNCDEI
jgi:hypothetical protein